MTFRLTNIYCRNDLSHVGAAGGHRALSIVDAIVAAAAGCTRGWSFAVIYMDLPTIEWKKRGRYNAARDP